MTVFKKEIDFDLKDFLLGPEPKTFLVGAGCSIDPPSCLPAGRFMMEAIVRFVLENEEIPLKAKLERFYDFREQSSNESDRELKKILQYIHSGALRFETLVELLRTLLIDVNLKTIDFYEQCHKPNLQHFFFAKMIKEGHFVMTTNFDFLIEHALLQSGVLREKIFPIITRSDFEEHSDPTELHKQGKMGIYKIHGSSKNIITEEKTKKSLIVTLSAFMQNKESLNIFQIEPYKRPLFEKITSNRNLVVLGYSGSDDFDIIPTIKALKNIRNIFWINHVDEGPLELHEIISPINHNDLNVSTKKMDKTDQILMDIKRINSETHIFRVNVNTSKLVGDLFETKPKMDSEKFEVSPLNWLRKNIDIPWEKDLDLGWIAAKSGGKVVKFDLFLKYYFPFRIHLITKNYDAAIRIAEELLRILRNRHDWEKILLLNDIGVVFHELGKYKEAYKLYKHAFSLLMKNYPAILDVHAQFADTIVADIINNIGLIYEANGNYDKAMSCFKEILAIDMNNRSWLEVSLDLNNIGLIDWDQKNYNEALTHFTEALKLIEHLKITRSNRSFLLNNIGGIHEAQGKYLEALNYYKEAFQLAEQLGNLREIYYLLINIARTLKKMQTKDSEEESDEFYQKARDIAKQLGEDFQIEGSPLKPFSYQLNVKRLSWHTIKSWSDEWDIVAHGKLEFINKYLSKKDFQDYRKYLFEIIGVRFRSFDNDPGVVFGSFEDD